MNEAELREKINDFHILVPGEENKKVIIHQEQGRISVFSIELNEMGWFGIFNVKSQEIKISPAMGVIYSVQIIQAEDERIILMVNNDKYAISGDKLELSAT